MVVNLRNSIITSLNPGLRQSITGGSDAIRSYGASISVYPHDLGQLPNPITRRIDIEIEYGSGAVYDLNPIS